jgi:hypothetical protein
MNNLYRHNRNIAQWSTGGAYLQFLYEVGPHKLITGVECEFLAIQTKQMALLDTGSEERFDNFSKVVKSGPN